MISPTVVQVLQIVNSRTHITTPLLIFFGQVIVNYTTVVISARITIFNLSERTINHRYNDVLPE